MNRRARIVDFEEARSTSCHDHRLQDARSMASRKSSCDRIDPTVRPADVSGRRKPEPNRNARSRAIKSGQVASARRGERPPRFADKQEQRSLQQRKSDARKRKAKRAYEHAITQSPQQPSEGGPRAAVYQGQMGPTHRRSSQMRNEQENVARKRDMGHMSPAPHPLLPRIGRAIGLLFACVLLCMVAVYRPAHDYYFAIRDEAKAQAQLEVLNEQNEELHEEVDHLSTDEGIQDKAAIDYGWVQQDENPVIVSGVHPESQGFSSALDAVDSTSVKAPDTWYSGFLDSFFGYTI